LTPDTKQFSIEDVIFVGDRGMVKKAGKQALGQAGFRYISALTDPQIRLLLTKKTIQLELFAEQVREAEAGGVRYILRRNPAEAQRIRHRLEDKLDKLRDKIAQRNKLVDQSARRKPEAGLAALRQWVGRHKIAGLVALRLDGRHIAATVDPAAELGSLELAGCYVIVTDVAKDKLDTEAVHASYMALQKVERDFRTMKTGLLEIRPLFVRKESRARGHVFCCLLALKLQRELERRLVAAFGTTAQDPNAVTVSDALAALGRLCLLNFNVDKKTVVTRLPKPDEHQRKILDALKVSLPVK
jgi:transposase